MENTTNYHRWDAEPGEEVNQGNVIVHIPCEKQTFVLPVVYFSLLINRCSNIMTLMDKPTNVHRRDAEPGGGQGEEKHTNTLRQHNPPARQTYTRNGTISRLGFASELPPKL